MRKSETYFLVQALKQDDMSSLGKLYKMYYSKLYAFSKKFDQASIEPDDFVQQTFIKLWDNRHLLKEDVLFDKQIFIICKNIILNQLKRDKKIQNCSNLKEISSEPSDELQQEDHRNIRKLHSIIERLPKKRREIFKLHKINNLTYEEIAGSHQISEKTIANHIYLAMLFIRKEMYDFDKSAG